MQREGGVKKKEKERAKEIYIGINTNNKVAKIKCEKRERKKPSQAIKTYVCADDSITSVCFVLGPRRYSRSALSAESESFFKAVKRLGSAAALLSDSRES